MIAARRLDPADSVCWFGLGLSLALTALVALNVGMEDRVREYEVEAKPVVLPTAVCGRDDWACELDVRVLAKGNRFDKRGRVVLAARQ